MRHFTSAADAGDIAELVQLAIRLKQSPAGSALLGSGRRIGLLFLNPSMRTRISTQIAARNLGLEPMALNMDSEGWKLELEDGAVMNGSTVEHIRDAAPVLGTYFDILAVRTFPTLSDREQDYSEPLLTALKRYAGIPVVSLESATLHPLQSLADLMTISESFQAPGRPKVVLTWAPHVKPLPQCVANSFAQWMTAWGGAEFTITHPEGFDLDEPFTQGALITTRQDEALRDADFVYVKNWSSFRDYGRVLTGAEHWMLTPEKLRHAPEARIMHCLPVRREVELSGALLDSPASLVTQQAGNRIWAAQAVLHQILLTLNQKRYVPAAHY